MDSFDLIIIGSFIGFALLAALVLVPVYRFLQRERASNEVWMKGLEEHSVREHTGTNGKAVSVGNPSDESGSTPTP